MRMHPPPCARAPLHAHAWRTPLESTTAEWSAAVFPCWRAARDSEIIEGDATGPQEAAQVDLLPQEAPIPRIGGRGAFFFLGCCAVIRTGSGSGITFTFTFTVK